MTIIPDNNIEESVSNKFFHDYLGFRNPQPSINEFLTDPYFLGHVYKENEIFPIVKERLEYLHMSPYMLRGKYCILKGAIGTGKTTFTQISVLRNIYSIMSLEDPRQTFGMMFNQGLWAIMYNKFDYKAKPFAEFIKDIIASVPAFQDIKKARPEIYNLIKITYGSTLDDILSNDIAMVALSEINFIKEDRAWELIREADSRLHSRVRKAMGINCALYIDSSDVHVDSPTEIFIKERKRVEDHGECVVFSAPHWVAHKHSGVYWNLNPKGFWVYAGDSEILPHIVKENEDTSRFDKDRLLEVPMELYPQFSIPGGLGEALQKFAGIALLSSGKLFTNVEELNKAFVIEQSCPDVFLVDFYNNERIIDQVMDDINALPDSYYYYIRIDLGITRDLCGISIGHADEFRVTGFKEGDLKVASIKIDIAFGLSRKIEQETSIAKVRDFIIDFSELKPLKRVTTDQYQSRQIEQELNLRGIPCSRLSVDRTTEPYIRFKNLIYQGLIRLPKVERLKEELKGLEYTGNKIDHPSSGCLPAYSLIKTHNNNKKIIDLIEDVDKVYAFDIESNEFILTDFTNLRLTKWTNSLLTIYTIHGIIECTKNHLILTTNGYISAENINNSHFIINQQYKKSKVINVIESIVEIPVYDIEVPIYSNFCLSNGLVVHNSKDIADAVSGVCYMILEDGEEALDTPRKVKDIIKSFTISMDNSVKNRRRNDIIRRV